MESLKTNLRYVFVLCVQLQLTLTGEDSTTVLTWIHMTPNDLHDTKGEVTTQLMAGGSTMHERLGLTFSINCYDPCPRGLTSGSLNQTEESSWMRECPADGRTWVPFGGKCYHFVHGAEDQLKSYTFERAKSLCQGFGLLAIKSAEENDFVIKYSPEVWKGIVNMWLGMYYDTDSDEMRWLSEDPVKFTNWENSSFPSEPAPIDTCAVLHSNTGKWENVSCQDEVENGVVCETTQKAEDVKQKPSVLVSALVILSVVAIVGVSVVVWFWHQKHNVGSSIFTAFEYHPPFRVLESDHSCLVEDEETNDGP